MCVCPHFSFLTPTITSLLLLFFLFLFASAMRLDAFRCTFINAQIKLFQLPAMCPYRMPLTKQIGDITATIMRFQLLLLLFHPVQSFRISQISMTHSPGQNRLWIAYAYVSYCFHLSHVTRM